MPTFDLRGIKIAKYNNVAGSVSYGTLESIGDAMNVNLQLKYAEGRLYAESSLAEYIRKAIGGSISIGVKYIPNAAQQTLFGARTATRSVTYTAGTATTTKSVTSLKHGAKDSPAYVGVGFYAPDMVDGVEKYTAVKVARALFGLPSMNVQTLGENIVFQTPTTTGEFLPDHAADKDLIEVTVCDSEAEAKAWIEAVLV